MTDDRRSGIALIAGCIGSLVTMAIHPTAPVGLTASQLEHLAVGSAVAHTLAMVSLLAMFLGGCGLARRLGAADRLGFCGIVLFGFAVIAALIGTSVSGFIVPNIMRHMVRDVPTAEGEWRMILYSVFQFNQTFSQIYTVAASVAMVVWSACALRNGGLGRGIATYGCVAGPLLILGIFIGHLRLDVHGMTAVVVCQAVWFIGSGVQLYRAGEAGFGGSSSES